MKKSTVFSFLLGALTSSIVVSNKNKIRRGLDVFRKKINKKNIDLFVNKNDIDLLDRNVFHPRSTDITFLNNIEQLSDKKISSADIIFPEDYLNIDRLLWKRSTLKALFDRNPEIYDGNHYVIIEPIYYDNPFNVSKAILLQDTTTNEKFFIGVEFNDKDDRDKAIEMFIWKYFAQFCYSGNFKIYSLDSSVIERDLGLNVTLDYKTDECVFFWISNVDFKLVQDAVSYKNYLFFGLPTPPGYEYEAVINYNKVSSDFKPKSKILEVNEDGLPIAFSFMNEEDATRFISFIKEPFKEDSVEFKRTYKELREYMWDNFNILLHDDFLDCIYTANFIKYENPKLYDKRVKDYVKHPVITINWRETEKEN